MTFNINDYVPKGREFHGGNPDGEGLSLARKAC